MERRRYLALVGMGALAGCSGDESGSDNTPTSAEPDGTGDTATSPEPTPTERPTATKTATETETDTPTETETDTPTETRTPEPFSEITVGNAELITIETALDDEVGAEVVITNEGDAIAPSFEIGVDWLDADGEYIATSSVYGEVLEAGETYIARTPAWLDVEEPERIEGVEATVTDESPFGEADIYPEGIEVTQSTTRASDEDVVVRGVIENNRDTTEYLEYGAKVYNENGDVIGIGTGIEEVAGGDSWRFESNITTHGRNGQVESGKVIPYI